MAALAFGTVFYPARSEAGINYSRLAPEWRGDPLQAASRPGLDRHGSDLRVLPRMVLQQVNFQLRVVGAGGLEQQLPLLASAELAIVPER